MAHTTCGSEKTDGGKHPRARTGRGLGQGQSLWIDLCVPSAPPRPPRPGAPPVLPPPPLQSPGSHTLNSSHWALAWDVGPAGCIFQFGRALLRALTGSTLREADVLATLPMYDPGLLASWYVIRDVNMCCERVRASTIRSRFWHRCGGRFWRPSFGFAGLGLG